MNTYETKFKGKLPLGILRFSLMYGRMGCSEVCHCFMLTFKPQNVNSNVSFYLIAILALHVKCQSLQERDVPENVLIVDHHVKKIFKYIYYSFKVFPQFSY